MGECVNGNGTSPTILAAETHRMDDRGRIDDVMNIRNTKLFLLHGTLDTEMNTSKLPEIICIDIFIFIFIFISRIMCYLEIQVNMFTPTQVSGLCGQV